MNVVRKLRLFQPLGRRQVTILRNHLRLHSMPGRFAPRYRLRLPATNITRDNPLSIISPLAYPTPPPAAAKLLMLGALTLSDAMLREGILRADLRIGPAWPHPCYAQAQSSRGLFGFPPLTNLRHGVQHGGCNTS